MEGAQGSSAVSGTPRHPSANDDRAGAEAARMSSSRGTYSCARWPAGHHKTSYQTSETVGRICAAPCRPAAPFKSFAINPHYTTSPTNIEISR